MYTISQNLKPDTTLLPGQIVRLVLEQSLDHGVLKTKSGHVLEFQRAVTLGDKTINDFLNTSGDMILIEEIQEGAILEAGENNIEGKV